MEQKVLWHSPLSFSSWGGFSPDHFRRERYGGTATVFLFCCLPAQNAAIFHHDTQARNCPSKLLMVSRTYSRRKTVRAQHYLTSTIWLAFLRSVGRTGMGKKAVFSSSFLLCKTLPISVPFPSFFVARSTHFLGFFCPSECGCLSSFFLPDQRRPNPLCLPLKNAPNSYFSFPFLLVAASHSHHPGSQKKCRCHRNSDKGGKREGR